MQYLTNLKLYLSNGTEVPSNTSFSLNFDYMVGLQKEDANGTSGTPILPSETTPTSVYFNINSTEGSFSNADLSLGDTYDEFQGNTTVPNKKCNRILQYSPHARRVHHGLLHPDIQQPDLWLDHRNQKAILRSMFITLKFLCL